MEPLPKQLTLASFFSVLWRQRYFMAVIVIASLALGYLAFKRAKPVWESSTELMVQGTSQSMQAQGSPMQRASLPGSSIDVPTQIEILESGALLDQLYNAAGLPDLPQYMSQEQRDSLPVLRVEQVGSTNVMRVFVDSADYNLADLIGSNLYNVYNNYVKANQQEQVTKAVDFLRTRLGEEKAALATAQKALDDFKSHRKLVAVNDEGNYRSARVTSTQGELTKSQTAVALAQQQLEALIKERKNLPKSYTTPTQETNPDIEAELQTIEGLEADRAAALKTYQEDNPVVVAIDAKIDFHEAKLKSLPKFKKKSNTTPYPFDMDLASKILQARISLKTAQLDEERDASEAATAQREFNYYNSIAAKQDDLTQAVSDRRAAVLATTRAYEELQVQENSIKDPVKQLITPSLPSKVKPKGVQYMALAFLMGLFIAAGFALTKDGLEDKLSSAEEIFNLTGLPSLGELPALPSRLPVLAEGIANEAILESYRVLRFNIKFSTLDHPVRSIVVTSSGPSEGKTELACNLAIAASGEGRRVILVDANLRNPMIHKKMNVAGKPGLTDVVAGEADLDESMHWTSIPGLRVLTCGSLIGTPAELLASTQMRDVYDRLVADSDLVIFDAPSCLGFADTQVLANVAESVLYVAKSGTTKRLAVKKGIESLRQSNARILGVATSGGALKTVKS